MLQLCQRFSHAARDLESPSAGNIPLNIEFHWTWNLLWTKLQQRWKASNRTIRPVATLTKDEFMSRIIFRRGDYYEEFSPRVPVENGEALFLAQREYDLKAARRHQEELRKALPKRIAKSLLYGFSGVVIGLLFLWFLISLIHWFWFHSVW